jgi:cyclase
MAKPRLIARLDIKQGHLIKGIHLEGWRKVGSPAEVAEGYYSAGIDELLYMDVVASLYGRNNLLEFVEQTARRIFVPLCVGGGIRSVEDADLLFRAGADKVAVNTAAIANPSLLTELSRRFGSQAVVLSIEAKSQNTSTWECFTDNGREHTGKDVVRWAAQAKKLGVGEILVTSVDRDGTKRGLDLDLMRAVSGVTDLPVIACGGVGCPDDVTRVLAPATCEAVALATALHYNVFSLAQLRADLAAAGVDVRRAAALESTP